MPSRHCGRPSILVLSLMILAACWGTAAYSRGNENPDRAASSEQGGLGRYLPTSEELHAAYQSSREGRSYGKAYKTRIRPHWFADNSHFWYRNELRGGRREYVLVDASRGVRRPAFDHERLAQALTKAGVGDVRADCLALDQLELDLAGQLLEFRTDGKTWSYHLQTYELTERDPPAPDRRDGLSPLAPEDVPRGSTRRGPETELTFVNDTAGEVELFWLETNGQRRSYGKLPSGERRRQHTYSGHVWALVDQAGTILAVFQATDEPNLAIIADAEQDRPVYRWPSRRRRAGRAPERNVTSPDGKWAAYVEEHDVYVRPLGSDDGKGEATEDASEPIRITTDGTPEKPYGRIEWAPDSQTLVAFRVEPGDRSEVHLVESSPEEGGRAKLHTRPYALPGDKFAIYEINLFSVGGWEQTKPHVEPIDFGRPRLRWNDDGRRFTYEKVDRGHQRFRVIQIDSRTGEHRHVLVETTDTFIWTAHGPAVPPTTYLERTNEILYASERDGWRHLYLVDIDTGKMSRITRGKWVVRGIEHIDEEKRQVWFRASGMQSGQDPYLVHYYRINFDGAGLVALTEGDGNHSVQFSPDRQYLIDSWSRVDHAPVHELRRSSDGQRMCKLETADTSELRENEWTSPEVFVAKGRDGKTDIWGIICRPHNFDPTKSYPVIEHIYAGPHDSYVPKSFRDTTRFSSLRELGFVVVQMDGMGTANRSKAFHDICWKNLKDAGFPDRILWHKAVAEKYAWYDISNVGIYGTSAGGQNAAAAVLFHPEFYKTAVSACGCHDNRLDKASWNEQWMGYPVGPQYAECSNIDHAHRLEGNLLLIVGEMDYNVPPESTLRLANALIKADKDFELLVVPGAGHGMGGSYGRRKMRDFFVKHLHGVDPPNDNRQLDETLIPSPLARADMDPDENRGDTANEDPADDANRHRIKEPSWPLPGAGSELRELIERYAKDRQSVFQSLPEDRSIRSGTLKTFYEGHLKNLDEIPFDRLSHGGQVDYILLRNQLERELRKLELKDQADAELSSFVPFAWTARKLADAQSELKRMEWRKVAGTLVGMTRQIRKTQQELKTRHGQERPGKVVARRAASRVDDLQRTLRQWHKFYDGYDPLFTWWISEPYKSTDKSLEQYAEFLREEFVQEEAGNGAAQEGDGGSDIVGRPIGREALLSELQYEMIPYGPEDLIAIAEKEYAWCEEEMKRASGEVGFGDDWHAALEHVKSQHVDPGEQPYLIRDLAEEAVEYLEAHNLITVPPLCRDSWDLRMMSPERQRVNPFFTGGRVIRVSFPTDTMAHADKLMSMRGNNKHFARATVHHELIPGHHLQGFMTGRYKPYRGQFATPFWTEGWALYWEMLLYERGDFAKSPEDRIGMLFWRMHRCARIIFSLGFHLEQMTPQECIQLLVKDVGHERANAVAEVRRSFEANYDPLYQAAYMLGGLQFRALYRERVESGAMSAREFHDAILRENNIPVAMVRATLSAQPLTRDFSSQWKFYEHH